MPKNYILDANFDQKNIKPRPEVKDTILLKILLVILSTTMHTKLLMRACLNLQKIFLFRFTKYQLVGQSFVRGISQIPRSKLCHKNWQIACGSLPHKNWKMK